jgi:tetratricopeptide (TPR) repeat protein
LESLRSTVVRAVLRGVRRSLGVAQAQKDALSIEQLRALVRVTLGRDGLLGLRDRALVLLGFAAALRRSELVALTVEDLYSDLGNVLAAGGRLSEAILAYQRAIQLAPHDAGAHNGLGNVFYEQGKSKEASAEYRLAKLLVDDSDVVESACFAEAVLHLAIDHERIPISAQGVVIPRNLERGAVQAPDVDLRRRRAA